MKYLATLIVCLAVCGCNRPLQTGLSTMAEMEQTESNHQRLARATPPPQFDVSQERINLKRRLETFNVQNKISYIYLLGRDGGVITHYAIKGKVSSLNSFLTSPQQVVGIPTGRTTERTYHVLPSPDFDGSYGDNPQGIFFFLTDGTYVEYGQGTYLLTDRPMKISSPVVLTEVVGAKPTK